VAGVELLGSAELELPDDMEELKLAFSAEELPLGVLADLDAAAASEDPFSPSELAKLSSNLDQAPADQAAQTDQTVQAKGPRGTSSRRQGPRGTSSRRQAGSKGQTSSRRQRQAGTSSRRGQKAGASSRRGRLPSDRVRGSSSRRQREAGEERLPSGRVPPRKQFPWILVGLVGAVIVVGVAFGLVIRKRKQAFANANVTPTATTTPTPGASATPSEAPLDPLEAARQAYFEQRIADLEADLDLVSKDRPEDRGYELERLQGVLEKLSRSAYAKSSELRLRGSQARLRKLSSETKAAQSGGGERAKLAWAQLGSQFQVRFDRSLGFRHGGWQTQIERQLGGASFRTDLRREVGIAARSGGEALILLGEDPRWIGLFGERYYQELIRAGDLVLPEALREGRRWQEVRRKLVTHRRASKVYFAAHREVILAAARRDLEAAERALRGKGGPWISAIEKLLRQPRYVAHFKPRATTGGGGGSSTGSGGGGDSGGEGTQTRGEETSVVDLLAGDWRVRFRLGAKRYRKAKAADKPQEGKALAAVLDEAVAQAKESHEICTEAVELLDEYERLVDKEPAVHPQRDALHLLYFEEEFRLASGPMTFHALDEWCEKHERESWRAKIAPWLKKLRLVGQDGAKREKARRVRAEGIAAAGRFERSRRARLASKVEDLINWMREKGFATDSARESLLALIKAGVSPEDPFAGARLEAILQALPKSSGSDAKLAKLFEKKREGIVEDLRRRTFKAIAGAIRAGEPGRGFDFFQYLLRVDPENAKAHKKLGHIKVKDRWLRRFEAENLKKGLRWDRKLAWVRTKQEDKYRQGQVYDYQGKEWKSLSDANQYRANPARPWVIRTEHFELRSTADLSKTAWIADRLEAFYLVLFRHYDLFFAHKGGAGLVFGVSASQQKPFVVNFYRSRQQYVSHSNPIPGSAGFYSPGKHASFFYDQGPSVTTLQHEVTHQILGETLRGGQTSAWLTEGSAVYLEGVAESEGQLRLGPLLENTDLRMYVRRMSGGGEHSFTTITNLHSQAQWNANLDHRNYRGAGASVYFLIHMDGGRYRSDYLRMLKEGYLGKRSVPQQYTNLSESVLEELMLRFYTARSDG
jgi:uncharacterized protein DUF1570